jgi:hypothetical protein
MANTFELIASSTVGSGGAANIDFTSIPSTYTDLQLLLSLRTNTNSTSDQTLISFNGSTASFSARLLIGNGSAASSTTIARYTMPNGNTDLTASTFSSGSVYIPNYAGSTNKSYSADGVQENNATGALAILTAGLWSDTAAINQITLTPNAGSYVQYTTAYLYGVKNA